LDDTDHSILILEVSEKIRLGFMIGLIHDEGRLVGEGFKLVGVLKFVELLTTNRNSFGSAISLGFSNLITRDKLFIRDFSTISEHAAQSKSWSNLGRRTNS
jgi:hypothetical protein